MKQALYLMILSFSLSTQAMAQDTPIFPKGQKSVPEHHTGNVWLQELNHADSIFNYSIAVASFDPGARLDWHIHPGGQILMVTAGTGYYQEKDKPKETVHKGDVIKCLPGVEHWHGASTASEFTYIATTPTQKGRTIWLQKVSDEEYYGVPPTAQTISAEEEVINLSKEKWRWMSERKVDTLAALFDEKAVFVHMGGTMSRDQELDVIKSGRIQYKHAEVLETSVHFIGNTAILLNKIRLVAIVGGNEVINPFVVTEVYVKQNERWILGSLSFTKLLTP
jgi:quercetin dioxygenase-like cupin family protein